MSSSFLKRINKEIQLYQKDDFSFPNLILQPSESLDLWYFIIHDLKETDYEGGIYLGKVSLPPKYPFKAPDFQFITQSGRFEINKKICTSFTGFHNDLYSPSWNIASMCAGLISFMTDSQDTTESKGIGGISMSKEQRQTLAKESVNVIKNSVIFNQFFKNVLNINKLLHLIE
jgi:ubiquitin-protein ligase